LTPIGISRDALWTGLQAGRSAIRPVTRFDASIYRSQIAAEIDFHPTDFIEERRVRRLDRYGQFTVACGRLAIEDSGLNLAAEDLERVGSTMGSALGGVGFAEEQFAVFMNEGIKNVAVTLATNVFAGAASCNIAIEFGAMGRTARMR
jgi:3-oxoacyl-[acyl-carrier-protein] synthase II